MSEELKPCPCCGSDEIAEGYDTEGNSAFTCEGCGLGTAWEPTAVSRAAWNHDEYGDACREYDSAAVAIRDYLAASPYGKAGKEDGK